MHTLPAPCLRLVCAVRLLRAVPHTGCRPVFVMKGTGGAADRIQLVLDHMKLRLELDIHNFKDDGSDDEQEHADVAGDGAGCLTAVFGRQRAKVHTEVEALAGEAEDKGPEDVQEGVKRAEEGGLVDLENKINEYLAKFQEIAEGIDDNGDLFEKLDKQSRVLWLLEMKKRTANLKEQLNAVLALPTTEMQDRAGDVEALTHQLKDMHGASSERVRA